MIKYCMNHPVKKAINKCHHCNNYYCEECLNEGYEYYYCKKPECHKVYLSEILPERVKCPDCSAAIELEIQERSNRKFECPVCHNFINWENNPLGKTNSSGFVYITETFNLGDVAFIKSILGESDIDYYFSGENFLNMGQLVQPAKLFVRDDQAESVIELLKDVTIHLFGASAQTDTSEKNGEE
ncbi:MAG: hypothetical protein P8X42_11805 [Calditrichaceae bacterium]|jgi:hypothetical protein